MMSEEITPEEEKTLAEATPEDKKAAELTAIVEFWAERVKTAAAVVARLEDGADGAALGSLEECAAQCGTGDILVAMHLFELPRTLVQQNHAVQTQLRQQMVEQAGKIQAANVVPPLQKGPRRKKRN